MHLFRPTFSWENSPNYILIRFHSCSISLLRLHGYVDGLFLYSSTKRGSWSFSMVDGRQKRLNLISPAPGSWTSQSPRDRVYRKIDFSYPENGVELQRDIPVPENLFGSSIQVPIVPCLSGCIVDFSYCGWWARAMEEILLFGRLCFGWKVVHSLVLKCVLFSNGFRVDLFVQVITTKLQNKPNLQSLDQLVWP